MLFTFNTSLNSLSLLLSDLAFSDKADMDTGLDTDRQNDLVGRSNLGVAENLMVASTTVLSAKMNGNFFSQLPSIRQSDVDEFVFMFASFTYEKNKP